MSVAIQPAVDKAIKTKCPDCGTAQTFAGQKLCPMCKRTWETPPILTTTPKDLF